MQSVFEQDLERLVKQYDQPGPRYTSYPMVPVWPQGSFGREYAEALEAEGTKDRGISIYLHIPFCRTLCTFCGCNKVITRNAELVERYFQENRISEHQLRSGLWASVADPCEVS